MLKVQDEPEQKLLHGWLFVNTNVCWIRKLFFLFSFLYRFFFFMNMSELFCSFMGLVNF